MIGPQGMQPAPVGASAQQQASMSKQLMGLGNALMLAKMRAGKSPITQNGNFTGNVGTGTGMADQAPTLPQMDLTGAGPSGPMPA